MEKIDRLIMAKVVTEMVAEEAGVLSPNPVQSRSLTPPLNPLHDGEIYSLRRWR